MRKIFTLLFLFFTLESCRKPVNSQVFSSFSSSEISEINRSEINWVNLLEQSEEDYYAYIYSETCYYCKKIKEEIEEFSKVKKTYYVLFNEDVPISSERGDLIGVDDISSLYILGTPTLFHIEDKKVKNCFIGFNEIQAYIKEVLELIENKVLI